MLSTPCCPCHWHWGKVTQFFFCSVFREESLGRVKPKTKGLFLIQGLGHLFSCAVWSFLPWNEVLKATHCRDGHEGSWQRTKNTAHIFHFSEHDTLYSACGQKGFQGPSQKFGLRVSDQNAKSAEATLCMHCFWFSPVSAGRLSSLQFGGSGTIWPKGQTPR